MELLPLLLLIPMIFLGLGLLALGSHRLIWRLRDGAAWSMRKALACLRDGAALLFGAGLALESLRPMLPSTTGLMARVVLVSIGGAVALLLLARLVGQRPASAQR